MTDIVLRDIDEQLAERITRIGQAHGWDKAEALLRILDLGLHACERDGAVRLAEYEAQILQGAISALEHVPSDPGFARIGRAEPVPVPVEGPDQTIAAGFVFDSQAE
jgi:hypothetical protein